MKRAKNKSNLSIISDYLSGDRPFTQISMYQPEHQKHRNDGDVWEDKNGIKWTKKDGKIFKLTKTQGDIVRDAIGEQKCKVCKLNIKWGSKYDQLFFYKTGMCQDCIADFEDRLKVVGIFPIYELYKILSNERGFLRDAKSKLKEVIAYFSNEDSTVEILCNSDGFRERFHGTNKTQIIKDAKKDLTAVRRRLTELNKMLKEAKEDMEKKAKECNIKLYV